MNTTEKNDLTRRVTIEKLAAVQRIIETAAKKSSRTKNDITIIAVTKTCPYNTINNTINLGITTIGESRVVEAAEKFLQLPNRDEIETHLIGHLQSNKARKAVEIFDVIQSVDTLKLGKRINHFAEEFNKTQGIMIQVNTGADPAKYGFSCNDCTSAAQELNELENLSVEGVMMIAPFVHDEIRLREIFAKTREIQKTIQSEIPTCKALSMGMTADYPIAIEEGATHVRIGTALFGERIIQ